MGSAAEKPLWRTEVGWDGIEIGLWPHTVYFFPRNVPSATEGRRGRSHMEGGASKSHMRRNKKYLPSEASQGNSLGVLLLF